MNVETQSQSFNLLLADYCDLVSQLAQLAENSKEWKKVYDIINKETKRMIKNATRND